MKKDLLSSYEQEALMFTYNLLKDHLSPHYYYHNFHHTQETVITCHDSAIYYNFDHTQRETLILAGIFHDTGHINDYQAHEEESCKIAEKYLQEHKLSQHQIDDVIELIRSTKHEHKRINLLQKVLHDADMVNLGKPNFFEKGNLLRKEWELILKRYYTDQEWERMQYDLLSNHEFLTDYAREQYAAGKNQNLAKQLENINKFNL